MCYGNLHCYSGHRTGNCRHYRQRGAGAARTASELAGHAGPLHLGRRNQRLRRAPLHPIPAHLAGHRGGDKHSGLFCPGLFHQTHRRQQMGRLGRHRRPFHRPYLSSCRYDSGICPGSLRGRAPLCRKRPRDVSQSCVRGLSGLHLRHGA